MGPVQGSRVVFTFDGDAAGQKAALHAFGLDGSFLTQTFVAVARENLDPCDLRIQYGDEAVRSLVEHARPLYDFVIDTAVAMFDTQYTTGQMGAVKAVAPILAQIRDRSLVGAYTRKTARKIGVDLDLLRQEVNRARRKLHVKDQDAYAVRTPHRSAGESEGRAGHGSDDAMQRRRIQREDALRQGYHHIDDSVFICEQQFMGVLIQIPRAIGSDAFAQLSPDSFEVPIFRSLYRAVQAAGGLPDMKTPQGLWMHNLTKAGGPMLESAINELAVMPLPLNLDKQEDRQRGTGPGNKEGDQGADSDDANVQLKQPSPEERQYASELLARLLDATYMRLIASTRHRMNQLPDGQEKFDLLGQLTQYETQRSELRTQVFGNTE